MQPFAENYQKRSLEFYNLHLFSVIHVLYIKYLLAEFKNTNKVITQLGNGNITMLIFSIKNAVSVATTVYAADSVIRMVMDVAPQEVKEAYVDPAFNYAYEVATSICNTLGSLNYFLIKSIGDI